MANVIQTYDQLITALPDNTDGEITEQTVRNIVKTLKPVIDRVQDGTVDALVGSGGVALATDEQDALTTLVGWVTAGAIRITPDPAALTAPMMTIDRAVGSGQTGPMLRLNGRTSGDIVQIYGIDHQPEDTDHLPNVYINETGHLRMRTSISIEPSGVSAIVGEPFMVAITSDIPGPGIAISSTLATEVAGGFVFLQFLASNRTTKLFRVLPTGEPHVQVAGLGVIKTAPNGQGYRESVANDGSRVSTLVYDPASPPGSAVGTPSSLSMLSVGNNGTLRFRVSTTSGVLAPGLASGVVVIESTDTGVFTVTPTATGTDANADTVVVSYAAVSDGTAAVHLKRVSDNAVLGTIAVTVGTGGVGFVEGFAYANNPTAIGNGWTLFGVGALGLVGGAVFAPDLAGTQYAMRAGGASGLRNDCTFAGRGTALSLVWNDLNDAHDDGMLGFVSGSPSAPSYWIYEYISGAAVNPVSDSTGAVPFADGDTLSLKREMDGTYTLLVNNAAIISGYTPSAMHAGENYGGGSNSPTSDWRWTSCEVS